MDKAIFRDVSYIVHSSIADLNDMTLVTESQLQRDPEIPKLFLDGARIGILLAEPRSGHVKFINKRGLSLLGYTAEDVNALRLSLSSLIDPEDRQVCAAEYARLLNGEIDQCQLGRRCLRKDGTRLWLQISVMLINDDNGNPQWCAVALGELSQQRILEQQLDAAKRLAGMITWSWEVKSDQAMTSGGAIIGFAKTPVDTLKKILLKIHPDDRRAVEATIKRAVVTGTGYAHEYRVINKNGELRFMRGTATCLFDAKGEVSHLVGASIDITDIKSRQATEQAPKVIRDILKYVEDNWNKPLYIADIARLHGISARAIQRNFASRGMVPLTQYVKQLRLRHAHQELSDPKPRTSVTGVALYCGFQNPGHFSRDYREAFGELPSETLRNAWQTMQSTT
jgi:PAS domain S-box-containing protein